MIVLRDKLFVFSNPYNGIYLFSIKLDLNEGNKLEKLVIMEMRNWDSGIFNLDVYFDKKVNVLILMFLCLKIPVRAIVYQIYVFFILT